MAEKIPGWIERLLLPKLSTLEVKIERLDGKLDALEKVMTAKFESIETQIADVRAKFNIS